MIVAGFGLNESFLLGEGRSKEKMTIISQENKPCYHPALWAKEFTYLYNDFINSYKTFHPMFARMPMYGIKDRFDLGREKRALKQGKQIYGEGFYDSMFTTSKNIELENSFSDVLEKFFLIDNQRYYSTMIKITPKTKKPWYLFPSPNLTSLKSLIKKDFASDLSTLQEVQIPRAKKFSRI
jgi:hypothetical protein